jgi:hypothetical protein
LVFIVLVIETGEDAERVHHPGRLIHHATRIRPVRDAAHAGMARQPQPHEVMPGRRHRMARVVWPLLIADQPGAAVRRGQSALEGDRIAGDDEGAGQFFAAVPPACINALAW